MLTLAVRRRIEYSAAYAALLGGQREGPRAPFPLGSRNAPAGMLVGGPPRHQPLALRAMTCR